MAITKHDGIVKAIVDALLVNPALAGGLVVTKAAQTSNAAGVMTITDAAIVPATQYRIVVVLASGAEGLAKLGAT